jgi:hypothetical protein
MIYSLGGVCTQTGQILNSIEAYALENPLNGWTQIKLKLPLQLTHFSGLSLPDGVLIIGGSTYDNGH